ncbi:MAG: hypothetical protein H8D67_18815 [Deltaproteobacteria bacterium]|nr:hypothetical protein [Deltaproteobacteria bacterium]
MEKELEPDSLFQVLLKVFHRLFGIEKTDQINTERREILAASLRIDAIITFPDDFDFTRLTNRLFPWLGKKNVFEYKGKSDRLKLGQYCQYALVELGLMLIRCLSKERKDRTGKEWLSQKGTRDYWGKLKSRGAKHLCTATILSTGDPVGLREAFGLEPVNQYSHLQGSLYGQVIFQNKLFGSIPVYLIVLNKLKVCPINAPLLLLSTGEKNKEFCRWLFTDAEGLTIEERVTYESYLFGYNLIEDEEVKREMGRRKIKFDYGAVAEVFGPPTAEEVAKFIQKEEMGEFIQKVFDISSPKEAVLEFTRTLKKTKREQKELLELILQEIENSEVNENSGE